jgi:ubiquinone/menaquinone biosynthesis C-methylase UbiE
MEFDEKAAAHLEKAYQITDAVRRRQLVRDALQAAAGERILDIGCGPGFYCVELLDALGPAGSVVGVDSSPQMLELARRRCAGHDNVELRSGEATALPVDSGAFDAALCVQVMEYVRDIDTALGEMRRALRPGGRVLIWDIDWATVVWHSEDPARMEKVRGAWDQHLVHTTLPRSLSPALRAAGFDHVEMQAHSFASATHHPDSFGVALLPVIERFASGRNGVDAATAAAWTAEQRELGERGAFFFAAQQFCFTARRRA